MIKKIIFFFTFLIFLFTPSLVRAGEMLEGKISNILEEKVIDYDGVDVTYQKLEVQLDTKDGEDKQVVIENGLFPSTNPIIYRLNDKVLINQETLFNYNDQVEYQIIDFLRQDKLILLFIIFIALTIFIAKIKGFTSLLSMTFTFLIIFKVIIPYIYNGYNPILVIFLSSLIIIPVAFYLSHGLNKKTTVALISTIITLLLTGFLSTFFVKISRLSGFTSDEAGFLQAIRYGFLDMKNILIAGIIIGVLGVLDDVTISQVAIVEKLQIANPKYTKIQLYKQAMSIGQDHIASMINTLILVYTGAAMPLLLLFMNNPQPFSLIVNNEIIAEEIIRTLVGSICLILAVPLSTYLATLFFKPSRQFPKP
jgi:uncharacterized membrane protein